MSFIRGVLHLDKKIVPLYHQVGELIWINERVVDGRLFAEELKTGKTVELETVTLQELLKED